MFYTNIIMLVGINQILRKQIFGQNRVLFSIFQDNYLSLIQIHAWYAFSQNTTSVSSKTLALNL